MTADRPSDWWRGYRAPRRQAPAPVEVPALPATGGEVPADRKVVEWRPIRCPACRSHAVKVYGQSRAGGLRYVLCTVCGERFMAREVE